MNLYFFLKLKINSADSISHFRFRPVKRLLPAEIPGLLHTPAGIGLWFAEQNLIRWRGNIILANAEWLCVCCMWCKMNMRKAILTPREVLAREVSSLWLNLHWNGILEFCLPSMLSLAGQQEAFYTCPRVLESYSSSLSTTGKGHSTVCKTQSQTHQNNDFSSQMCWSELYYWPDT